MHESFLSRRANPDGDGGMAVELDLGAPDEVVAARSERLRHDHQDVIFDGDMRSSDCTMATGDGEVAAVDGVHAR